MKKCFFGRTGLVCYARCVFESELNFCSAVFVNWYNYACFFRFQGSVSIRDPYQYAISFLSSLPEWHDLA